MGSSEIKGINRKMVAVSVLLLVILSPVLSAQEVLNLQFGKKQLFIDDRFFAEQQGIELTVNPPVKAGMVLKPEMPWEGGQLGAYAVVLEDAGIFKLWYDAYLGEDGSGALHRSVCYATSTDGVNWDRPMVNIFNWFGHSENNIVMAGASASVMVDPRAPLQQRYKAAAMVYENDLWPETKGASWSRMRGGVWLFTSPDGINWKRVEKMASPFYHDSLNIMFFDHRLGKYVGYTRIHNKNVSIFVGRAVGRFETDDMMEVPWPYLEQTSKPNKYGVYPTKESHEPVMLPDEYDPPATDVQMTTVVEYTTAQDVYIGMWVNYRHFPENIPDKFLNDGIQDVQLAVSRNGIHWTRPGRKPYIALGLKGGPEGGCIWPTQGMLYRGNEIYQYYSPTSHTHGDYNARIDKWSGGIYLLKQRLDGFVSADANHLGGSFTTPPMKFKGTELELNVDAGGLGQLLVEVRDENNKPIPGYTLNEAVPIMQNQLAAKSQWRSGASVAGLQDRPIRLHVKMESCKLYAFRFGGPAVRVWK